MNETVTQVERPTADSLMIRRAFAAPASLIWRLWTDPAHMVRWWGPEGVRCGDVFSDLAVGGAWGVDMIGGGGVHRVRGVYRELDPPRFLSATWAWLDDDGAPGPESVYSVQLDDEADGVTLTLRHSLADAEAAGRHAEGWTSMMDALQAELSR